MRSWKRLVQVAIERRCFSSERVAVAGARSRAVALTVPPRKLEVCCAEKPRVKPGGPSPLATKVDGARALPARDLE